MGMAVLADVGDFVAANIFELRAGFDGERVLRIKAQEILIRGFCVGKIAEVALINFSLGEQRRVAEAAGGVLVAKEFVLADGVAESFLILKDAAFFGKQVGNGGDGGVGFG